MIALLLPTGHNMDLSNNSTLSKTFSTNWMFEILIKSKDVFMIFFINLRPFFQEKYTRI